MKPKLHSYIGCILGCAIGDAVGAIIERESRSNALMFVKQVVTPKEWGLISPTCRGREWTFGQYTDDTQLSRELMISIVENGGFDPEDYANRIRMIFSEGRIVGGGQATAQAATALAQGAHWKDSGTPPPRAGNGGPMRAAPIGLLHWNDSEALLRDAWDQAYITHQAEVSCATAVAMAMATAMSLTASRETSHPGEYGWWMWLARFVRRANEGVGTEFADDIEELAQRHFKNQEKASEVLQWVLEMDKESTGPANAHWDGISPWARTSTLWALYAFMRSPKDFWKTLSTALLAGGDTDTIAAMACALSGAYNGDSELLQADKGLLALVQDNGEHKTNDLIRLAVDFFETASSQHPEDAVNPVLPVDPRVREL